MKKLSIAMAALFVLAACGEKPQQAGTKKSDTHASQGTTNGHAAPGWKAGDEKDWETQLKNRAQRGQNEYQRTSGAS